MAGAANRDDVSITLGIEEELFLVDTDSRDLLIDPDDRIFEACEAGCGEHKVVREFLRYQIETNTKICDSVASLRAALREIRGVVVEAAEQYGAAVMAASTHPSAPWRTQAVTPRERYEQFAMTFQEGLRRFVIGGMHIHAGFGDADTRIRVMTALRRYLPLLHALSTSSPFNAGHDTGFKSYRLSLVGGLPRTGVPGPLDSWEAYDRLVSEYRQAKFIENGSELWWDIRPSHAYPTIELRICDVCTQVEDAMCIAALYACLIRWLARLCREGALPPEPLTELVAEDRWIAQRYGVFAFFGDSASSTGRVDIEDLLTTLVDELAADAEALECEAEVRRAFIIVRQGTGADRQIDLYRLRLLEGDTQEEALRHVVDMLLAETREGLGDASG